MVCFCASLCHFPPLHGDGEQDNASLSVKRQWLCVAEKGRHVSYSVSFCRDRSLKKKKKKKRRGGILCVPINKLLATANMQPLVTITCLRWSSAFRSRYVTRVTSLTKMTWDAKGYTFKQTRTVIYCVLRTHLSHLCAFKSLHPLV